MKNFLMDKGYWDYIEGDNENPIVVLERNANSEQIKALKDWNQGSKKVVYWLSIHKHDTVIEHIQNKE